AEVLYAVGATAHPATVLSMLRHRRISRSRVTICRLLAQCRSDSGQNTVDRDSRLATDHGCTARSIPDVPTASLTFPWPDAGLSLAFRQPPDSAILRLSV